MAKYLRGHWSIENQLHWMLDVVFREDASSVRMNHAPENLNILRKVALSLLRSTPVKGRMSAKAKVCTVVLYIAWLIQGAYVFYRLRQK